MKINLLANHISLFALMVLAAGSMAAQTGQQATFHLPFAAQWGEVTMAPGDYKVAVPDLATSPRQFLVQGKEERGFVLPMAADVDALRLNPSSKSYLELVKVNGKYFVAKYQSGMTGAVFAFKVPKPKYQVEMASQHVVDLDVSGR